MAEFESFLLSPWGTAQIASFLVLVSYMVTDFMKLRLSLIFANVFVLIPIIYQGDFFLQGGAWSVLFILVNAQRIWAMYLESRPAKLNKEQELIYSHLFRHMKPQQFRNIYKLGRIIVVEKGDVIVEKGQNIEHLRVVLSGMVKVIWHPTDFYLGVGQLIGEMGFLTRAPASADVIALEKVSYMEWSRLDLEKEYPKKSYVEHGITAAIGNDLIRKLQEPTSEYVQNVSSPKEEAMQNGKGGIQDTHYLKDYQDTVAKI
ncbi:MAG: hypothetical protein ACJA2O_004653 [Candidatus Azotimanducaceae bacterium]|jgi:hypothetical protein